MRKIRVLLVLSLLILGLFFRTFHLDRKVFWVDEVATVLRAAGYTKAEVMAQVANGRPHHPADLLAYQQLTPDRGWGDTVQALIRSPEHAPGYFLLTRWWMQLFGSSTSAVRSLSVLCSLLAWPCLYWFCQESLHSGAVSRTAVGLMAISPFFVAYAQEARPYSLWLLVLLFSSAAFLRSIRLNSVSSWSIYSISLILSCYTSLLSLPIAIAQGIYLLAFHPERQSWRQYGLAFTVAIVAFSPWLWVLLQQQAALDSNTDWMRTAIHPIVMVAIWLYSFAILFFDVPIVASGWLAIGEATAAAIVLGTMVYACHRLGRLPVKMWAIVALGLPVPFLLVSLDLIFRGQASATPRYLIPCQAGLLIAVAALIIPPAPKEQSNLSEAVTSSRPMQLTNPINLGHSLVSLLLCLSLISCFINLNRSPDYQKDRNRHNPELAAQLNQESEPILFAAAEQTIDLLSLSHELSDAVEIHVLAAAQLPSHLPHCRSIFVFAPSPPLIQALAKAGFPLTPVYQPPLLNPNDRHLSLWRTQAANYPAQS